MTMFFNDNRTVVVDIGSNVIKILGLRRKVRLQIDFWNAVDIYKTGRINRPDDINPTAVVQILREMFKPIRPAIHRVRSVLATHGSMIRLLELPLIAAGDLKAAIRLNLAGLIPFDLEKIEFNYSVLSTNRENKTQTIMVALAPSEEIGQHLEILKRAGLEPEMITPDQLAIYNCYHQLHSGADNDTVAVVNMGADRTTICFHHDDCCPSFSILPLGGNNITRSIEKHFHTSFLNAEEIKTGAVNFTLGDDHSSPSETIRDAALNQTVDQIADTIRTMHLNLQIKNCDSHLVKIMLTGGSARLRQIDFLLADRLKIPVYHWNPFVEPAMEGLVEPDVAETWGVQAAPALGLALEAEA